MVGVKAFLFRAKGGRKPCTGTVVNRTQEFRLCVCIILIAYQTGLRTISKIEPCDIIGVSRGMGAPPYAVTI